MKKLLPNVTPKPCPTTKDDACKIIDEMAVRWPSSLVPRKKVSEFTGGSVSAKLLANADWKGTGPAGRFLLANQTVYPIENLVAWLKDRIALSWQTRKAA